MEEELVEYQRVGSRFIEWFRYFRESLKQGYVDEEVLMVVGLSDAIGVALIPRKLLSLYE